MAQNIVSLQLLTRFFLVYSGVYSGLETAEGRVSPGCFGRRATRPHVTALRIQGRTGMAQEGPLSRSIRPNAASSTLVRLRPPQPTDSDLAPLKPPQVSAPGAPRFPPIAA